MKKILILTGIVLSLTGCANAINSSDFDNVELKNTTEGVKYKKFQIEGCTFIGTQDNEEVWHYSGPISCSKQVAPGNQY
jgi:uncharacterized lipoprotein NlpE involved in copper resistance